VRRAPRPAGRFPAGPFDHPVREGLEDRVAESYDKLAELLR
jgi:hypothetical protein